jgi:hypothetical protein
MRAAIVGGLVAATVLAGCTAPPSGLDVDPTALTLVTTDPQTGDDLFLKPNLTVGRWWDVRLAIDYGNGFLIDLLGKIVVSGTNTSGFRVGSDNPDFGILDAYFDSFYVGSLDDELNPRIAGHTVRFFDWPLRAGQTWTTKIPRQGFGTAGGVLDDVEFNVTAFEEDTTPFAPRLRVQGLTSYGETIDFDYSARTGWMTYFRMVNATTGQVVVALDFRDSGPDYRGPVHHLARTILHQTVRITPPFDPSLAPVPPTERVEVPDGFTSIEEIKALFTFPIVAAGGGEVAVVVSLPNGTTHRTLHTGAGDVGQGTFNRTVNTGSLAGTWTVTIAPAATGGAFVGLYGFKDETVELR